MTSSTNNAAAISSMVDHLSSVVAADEDVQVPTSSSRAPPSPDGSIDVEDQLATSSEPLVGNSADEASPAAVRVHFDADSGSRRASLSVAVEAKTQEQAPFESPDASPASMLSAFTLPTHVDALELDANDAEADDEDGEEEGDDVAMSLGGGIGGVGGGGTLNRFHSSVAGGTGSHTGGSGESGSDTSGDEESGGEEESGEEDLDVVKLSMPSTTTSHKLPDGLTPDEAEIRIARNLYETIRGPDGNEANIQAFYERCSNIPSAQCLRLLHARLLGVSMSSVALRLRVFGPNSIESESSLAWYAHLWHSFAHPFNLLLSVLVIVAGCTGDNASVGLICAMISISVGISFVQERKAAISAKALQAKVTHKASVRRPTAVAAAATNSTATATVDSNQPAPPSMATSTCRPGEVDLSQSNTIEMATITDKTLGKKASSSDSASSPTAQLIRAVGSDSAGVGSFTVESVPSGRLVPGDIVILTAGSLVPADMRLLSTNGMMINQTILTGESLPVEKSSRPFRASRVGANAGTPEASDSHWLRRDNLAFMGSSVECGSGVGVVLATGGLTYFGRNAAELQVPRPPSAFTKGVRQVSFVLMAFTAIMLPLVIIINGVTEDDWVNAALFGAAVAVGITPTMLPMIVQGNLSLAAHRLSKRKCLVKRLEAIQNIGAINVLCTDKTGTLTNDQVALYGVVNAPTDVEARQECTTASIPTPPPARVSHEDDANEEVSSSLVAVPSSELVVENGDVPLAITAATQNEWLLRNGPTIGVAYTIAKQQTGFRNVLDHAIIRAYEEAYGDGVTHVAPVAAPPAPVATEGAKKKKKSKKDAAHEEEFHEELPVAGAGAVPDGVKLPTCWGRLDQELPWDFGRRRMSVIVQHADVDGANNFTADKRPTAAGLFCKGALSETLSCCTHVITGDASRVPLDAAGLIRVRALGERLAAQGLRVLAVAQKLSPMALGPRWSIQDESGLTLVGLLTFLDQPKPSAYPALQKLAELGIAVKVLTGDNPLVAKQVCAELGMDSSKILTGEDMSKLGHDDDDPALQQLFYDTVLFAQLTPHDKARVVRCLRFRGEVTGFLGDGINDALALRESDVGVSVDTGSELAKDAADLILTEKDLNVLGDAVRTGRLTHANSIKYIKMAASGNFGNCFSLLIAAAWLPFLPMRSIQLLLQNLLYDISQIAIPFDTMDAEYLREPQHWSGGNLATFMMIVGPVSSVFDVATFLFAWYAYGLDSASNEHDVRQFQTMWFMEGLMTQTLIVHMIRTEKLPFIESRASNQLLATTVIITAIGFVVPYIPPLADALEMVAPPGHWFVGLLVIMFAYAALVSMVKKLYIKKFGQWL